MESTAQRGRGVGWGTGRRCRRLIVVLGALLALVAASCGGSTSTGPEAASPTSPVPETTSATAAPSTTPAVATFDSAQLEGALLTLDELPPMQVSRLPVTWTVSVPAASGPRSGGGIVEALGRLCPSGAPILQTEFHAASSVTFSKGGQAGPDYDIGPDFSENLVSAADAEAHFDDVNRAFSSCVGQTWTDEASGAGAAGTDTFEEGPALGVGDESSSYRWTTQMATGVGTSTTFTDDWVLVRRGSVLELYSSVGSTGGVFGALQFSSDQLLTLVTAGDDKVVALIGAAA